MEGTTDNCIEFVKNSDMASCTFSQLRWINKIYSLAKKYPDEVKVTAVNEDGSIVAHMPVDYIHISRAKKDLSEEEKMERMELLNLGREIRSLDENVGVYDENPSENEE